MAMRFGLIGTGYWARSVHGRALADHPGTELVGVWGRSADSASAVANELGSVAYSDLDAMLEDVEAVAIAVPPDVQSELAAHAADKRKHLLLDKPLALSPIAADRLVAAVDRAGIRNLVFFTLRFSPSVSQWLETLPAPTLMRSARVRLHTSIYEPGSPYASSPWRRQYGALWDIGPHALSVLLPALGPVVELRALRGRDDEVEVITRHEDGAIGSMSLSLTSPPADRSAQWSIYSADAELVMPDSDEPPTAPYGRMIDDLLAGQHDARWSHPCDAHFARAVTQVLDTASQALRQGS